MLDFLIKKFRGEKEEDTIEAIPYKSYRDIAYVTMFQHFDILFDIIFKNRKAITEITKDDDLTENKKELWSKQLTDFESHMFFICLKIKDPNQLFINFDLLKECFPYAKHNILEMRIESSHFFRKTNNEMETLFTRFHQEHTTHNPLKDTFILAMKMTKFYYNYLNTKIIELYLESERKAIESLIRKENSWKKNKKQKKASNQDFGLDVKSTTKIEQKDFLPVEYFEKVISVFQKYVPTKNHNKVQKYITRILESAYTHNKPAPIDTLLVWLKENFNISIQDHSEFEHLKQEAPHYGFDISKKLIEEIHEKVRNALSTKENEDESSSNIGKNEDINTNPICTEEKLLSDMNSENMMNFFEKTGFHFSNKKKFEKQFDCLLYMSQFGKEKRNKFVRILNGDATNSWEVRPNEYFILKIDARGEALRLVRKNDCIVDFLNHDEYIKKYRRRFNE